jgi:hypothetical protein
LEILWIQPFWGPEEEETIFGLFQVDPEEGEFRFTPQVFYLLMGVFMRMEGSGVAIVGIWLEVVRVGRFLWKQISFLVQVLCKRMEGMDLEGRVGEVVV